jgi:hypothetical protein
MSTGFIAVQATAAGTPTMNKPPPMRERGPTPPAFSPWRLFTNRNIYNQKNKARYIFRNRIKKFISTRDSGVRPESWFLLIVKSISNSS